MIFHSRDSYQATALRTYGPETYKDAPSQSSVTIKTPENSKAISHRVYHFFPWLMARGTKRVLMSLNALIFSIDCPPVTVNFYRTQESIFSDQGRIREG